MVCSYFPPLVLTRSHIHQAEDPEYSWVTRHTWQSWRERYKKNATRLDARIAGIVDQKKPAHGEKGQYGYVRKPEEKPKRTRKKRNVNGVDSGSPIAGPSGLQTVEYSIPVPMPLPPLSGLMGTVTGPNETFNHAVFAAQTSVFQHIPAPPPPSTTVNSATERREEEMEDDEEWQIREGDAPPPTWAKRKAEEEEGPNKKPRSR